MDSTAGNKDEILLRHEGELSLARSEAIFSEMQELVENGRFTRPAFRVLIELVQNIRIHGGARGSLQVWSGGGRIFLHTENRTSPDAAQKAADAANTANALSDSLKEEISRRRASPLPAGARGAGLGLMEIRRLCPEDIQCRVEALDENNSKLVITAIVEHK